MIGESKTIYVVDDDREVRMSLGFMLRNMDWEPRPFASGADLLEMLPDLTPGCILLDMRMPEPDGLAVLARLQDLNIGWPVIAVTGHGDMTLAVSAMKAGAIDFLEKPMEEDVLVQLLARASQLLTVHLVEKSELSELRKRFDKLSPRERTVLTKIVAGEPNKVVAAELGVSIRTVEMHRTNLLRKLAAKNAAEAASLWKSVQLAEAR